MDSNIFDECVPFDTSDFTFTDNGHQDTHINVLESDDQPKILPSNPQNHDRVQNRATIDVSEVSTYKSGHPPTRSGSIPVYDCSICKKRSKELSKTMAELKKSWKQLNEWHLARHSTDINNNPPLEGLKEGWILSVKCPRSGCRHSAANKYEFHQLQQLQRHYRFTCNGYLLDANGNGSGKAGPMHICKSGCPGRTKPGLACTNFVHTDDSLEPIPPPEGWRQKRYVLTGGRSTRRGQIPSTPVYSYGVKYVVTGAK